MKRKLNSDFPPLELKDIDRSDVYETIEKGKRLISAKVGIIKNIGLGKYFDGDIKTFSVGVARCDASKLDENVPEIGKAGGGGRKLEYAFASTIGEAVERYAMLFYDKREMFHGTYRDFEDLACHPDQLRLYSRQQIPPTSGATGLKYFDENTKSYWTWAWSLTETRWKLVPGAHVYLGYQNDASEDYVGSNASNGLAAGNTLEEAVLTGIYELIERDAFTLAWMCRHVNARVEIDDPSLKELLYDSFNFHRDDVEVFVYDVTLDSGIPSFFTYVKQNAEWGPAVCVGSATRLNPVAAIRKTLHETGQALPYFRFLMPQYEQFDWGNNFNNIKSFDDHAVFYLKNPQLMPKAFDFAESLDRRIKVSEMKNGETGRVLSDINKCVATLKGCGLEVLVADITTRDVYDAGFRVVRVLVPGLIPMHGHRAPYLGCERFSTIPDKLQWEKQGWPYRGKLNPYPHPFP